MKYDQFSKKVYNLFKLNSQPFGCSHFDPEGGNIQAELEKIDLNGPFLGMLQQICAAAGWFYVIQIDGKWCFFKFANLS